MTDQPTDERKCYQCGRDLILVFPDDAGEDSWLVCDNCGERIITVADFKKRIADAEFERVKGNLGVDKFLQSRKPNGVD